MKKRGSGNSSSFSVAKKDISSVFLFHDFFPYTFFPLLHIDGGKDDDKGENEMKWKWDEKKSFKNYCKKKKKKQHGNGWGQDDEIYEWEKEEKNMEYIVYTYDSYIFHTRTYVRLQHPAEAAAQEKLFPISHFWLSEEEKVFVLLHHTHTQKKSEEKKSKLALQ